MKSAFLSCYALFVLVPVPAMAQPSESRTGIWNGTNSAGHVLHIIEDNRDFKRGPLLKGWIRDPLVHRPLFGTSFSYGDNTFRASYMSAEQTNTVTVVYLEGNEAKGIAIGRWSGELVTFYERKP